MGRPVNRYCQLHGPSGDGQTTSTVPDSGSGSGPLSQYLRGVTGNVKDKDLAASVRSTQLYSLGQFEITRQGSLYIVTGIVKHKIQDTFNFNPGDRFYLPPSLAAELGKPWVLADDLNLLEKCKKAKPFQQDAYWKETLSARSGSFMVPL